MLSPVLNPVCVCLMTSPQAMRLEMSIQQLSDLVDLEDMLYPKQSRMRCKHAEGSQILYHQINS